MKSFCTALIATFSLLLTPVLADAAEISVDVRFSTHEASIIRDYYRQHTAVENKGRKRAKSLPPGIAKNLARGKPLPPGIAKQVLPGDLLGRLPPAHDGFERIVVGGKVLLVEIATQVIHDILVDAVLR